MRSTRNTLLHAAWLTVLVAPAAAAQSASRPLVVPHDRQVQLAVDGAPADTGAIPTPAAPPDAPLPPGATIAPPTRDDRPLGSASAAAAAPDAGGTGAAAEGGGGLLADSRLGELLRVGGALVLVMGLLLLLRAGLRRFGGGLAGGGQPAGILEVLGRFPIARGQQLILLKLSGRIVLLHQSRSAVTALSEVSDPDEVATLLARVQAGGRARGAGRFEKLIRRLTDRAAGDTEALDGAAGRQLNRGGKVVVDLTRRQPRAAGQARAGGWP